VLAIAHGGTGWRSRLAELASGSLP
jgi:hypothetical protein